MKSVYKSNRQKFQNPCEKKQFGRWKNTAGWMSKEAKGQDDVSVFLLEMDNLFSEAGSFTAFHDLMKKRACNSQDPLKNSTALTAGISKEGDAEVI